MRISIRTAKKLREQVASDRDILARKMSDLRLLRKIVADAEIAASSRGSRLRASLRRTARPANVAEATNAV